MSLCERLVAKQIVTAKVVAELLQKAEDVGNAADCWEGESVLLPVKRGCGVKQTGLSASGGQCSKCWAGGARPTACLRLTWLHKGNPCPGFLPPSLEGLIFASNSKGLAEMGVARPSLLHLGLWNDFTQLVKTTVNIILSAPSVGWASSRESVHLGCYFHKNCPGTEKQGGRRECSHCQQWFGCTIRFV